jgi:hypothetical protein
VYRARWKSDGRWVNTPTLGSANLNPGTIFVINLLAAINYRSVLPRALAAYLAHQLRTNEVEWVGGTHAGAET